VAFSQSSTFQGCRYPAKVLANPPFSGDLTDAHAPQVIAAGAVQALMQMQSLAYTGPFREAARKRLRALAATQPAARRQILEVVNVVQPAETQPAEWTAWWRQLRADVGLA